MRRGCDGVTTSECWHNDGVSYLFLHPFALSLSKRSDACAEEKEYLAKHAKLAKVGIDRHGPERLMFTYRHSDTSVLFQIRHYFYSALRALRAWRESSGS
jgi:hypothetical protein